VYFYESLSDNLHQYHAPSGRNVINPAVYASNGYLVFFPDIHYTDGFPGRSAMQSIVPGVQSLIARGYVDDIIDPRDTRPRLIDALDTLRTKRDRNPPKKHGNIPL